MARNNPPRLVLILIYLIIFIIAAEITLRLVSGTQNEYCLWRPYWKVTFKPYPGIMPGVTGNAIFEANSDGVRADELKSKHRFKVLAVGGSSTECLYIDQKKTWPYILQNNLCSAFKEEVWVGNIGRSGLSTTGNLIELKYLLPQYQKIDLIIALVGFNDFQSTLLNTYIKNNLKSDREKIEMVFIRRPFRPKEFYRNSAFLRTMQKLVKYCFKRNAGIVEDSGGSWYIGARNARKKAVLIETKLPDLEPNLAVFEDNINQMIDLAKSRAIRIVFLTQPYLWSQNLTSEEAGLLWFGYTEDKKKYYSIGALIEGLNKFNLRLRQVCKKRNVECIDLEGLIPSNTGFFYDDVHFNEDGCRRVAGIISEYLIAEKNKTPELI